MIDMTSPCILEAVRGAVAGGSASAEALAKAIASHLGGDGRVPSALDRALAEGIAELAAYACSPVTDDATVVDAELEAVAAARRAVRPILQAVPWNRRAGGRAPGAACWAGSA
jgi:hypothetical protein